MVRFRLAIVATVLLACSCGYMQGTWKQTRYSKKHQDDPSQSNLKHMIDRETFFVYGMIQDPTSSMSSVQLAVAAFSQRYRPDELVDVTHFAGVDTHYALNLPAGKYELLVLADRDQDGRFSQLEVVGRRLVNLSDATVEDRVLTELDIDVDPTVRIDRPISIPAPNVAEIPASLFYPQGTIRELGDPIFDPEVAVLGMYEPAAFLEIVPTMFYTLEEYLQYKVPVIFVHGIGGTVRHFEPIVARLDRDRYVPWFFYYPSGSSLAKLAENFHALFLSGELFPKTEMPLVVVAHSMGGLVVREALNLAQEEQTENQVALVITVASPLGGHPAAAKGEKYAPLVLPSWRDLNPDGSFIDQLYRRSLPPSVEYRLIYAYGNPSMFKLGENGDGVVPLSSQLHPPAQRQATSQFGFNSSHMGILDDEDAIDYLLSAIGEVKSVVPEAHIRVLLTGGFDVALDDSYSARQQYVIRSNGKYLQAMATGQLEPAHPDHLHFVQVARGRAEPRSFVEEAWLKLVEDHPELLAAPE